MRGRVLGAVLLLAVMSGDRVASFVNEELVREYSVWSSAQAVATFWYNRVGDQREALSIQADERHARAYQRVIERARARGFVFDVPRLRQTRPELALVLGHGIAYVYAMHYIGPRVILVNAWWTEHMSDSHLEMLLAHELAHAIDVQSERHGHWSFVMLTSSDDDDIVADVIASTMFGVGEYQGFLSAYPSR